MNELFDRFPDLVKSLIAKISQSNIGESNSDLKAARSKLMSQLHSVMEEISVLQQNDPQNLTEEQLKKLAELPRMLPSSMQWKIKPRNKPGGKKED